MNSTRIINVILVAVVVGLIAWGLTLIKVPQPAAPQEVKAGEYTESGAYYDIKVAYPAAPASERAIIESSLQADVADFKQSVSGLDPTVMPSLADHKLAFDAEFKTYTTPAYTSYFYTIYEDTGGAHPNGFFKTFVFDQSGRQVGLKDILGKNPQWLEELSLLVSNDVVAQLKQRLGQTDVTGAIFAEGLAPKEENFQTFVIDGGDLLIEIPPYQVAAYAAGTFEVRIKLSDIQ